MTRNEKLAWLAGIIDGEGTITGQLERCKTYHKDSYRLRVYIAVGMCNEKVVRKSAEIAGAGYVAWIDNDKYYDRPHQSSWYWRIEGDAARNLAKKLLPYLVGKQKQAELLIKTNTLSRYKGGRREKGQQKIPLNEMRKRLAFREKFIQLNWGHAGERHLNSLRRIQKSLPKVSNT